MAERRNHISPNIHPIFINQPKADLNLRRKKTYYEIAKYVGYMKHKNAYINGAPPLIVAPLKTIYFSILLKVNPECQKSENGFEGKRKRFFASSIFFLEHLLTLGWNYQCWRDSLISPTITGIGRLSSTEGPGDGVCLSSFQFVLSS